MPRIFAAIVIAIQVVVGGVERSLAGVVVVAIVDEIRDHVGNMAALDGL